MQAESNNILGASLPAISSLMAEMEQRIKYLEENGASPEMIAQELDIYESRIKIEMASSSGIDISSIISPGGFSSSAPQSSAQNCDASSEVDESLQAKVMEAIEASHREVHAIRSRGESERFVKQEEELLERTIEKIITTHKQLKEISADTTKEASAFYGLPPQMRIESDDAVSWVEEQFALAHVNDTSDSLERLLIAEKKYAEAKKNMAEAMQKLLPSRFDEKLQAEKQQRKLLRAELKEKEKSEERERKRKAKESLDAQAELARQLEIQKHVELEKERQKKAANRQQRLMDSFTMLHQSPARK
jgi:hypothetical protein